MKTYANKKMTTRNEKDYKVIADFLKNEKYF